MTVRQVSVAEVLLAAGWFACNAKCEGEMWFVILH